MIPGTYVLEQGKTLQISVQTGNPSCFAISHVLVGGDGAV